MQFCASSGEATRSTGKPVDSGEQLVQRQGVLNECEKGTTSAVEQVLHELLATDRQTLEELRLLRNSLAASRQLSSAALLEAKSTGQLNAAAVGGLPPSPADVKNKPKRVQFALEIRRLFDLKTKDQTFAARLDFTLEWKLPEGETPPSADEDDGDWEPKWTPKIRIFSTTEEKLREEYYTIDSMNGESYVRGQILLTVVIQEKMELQKFPNDCQDLGIMLQCKNSMEQCVLAPFEDGTPLVSLREDGCLLQDFALLKPCVMSYGLFENIKHSKNYSAVQIRVKVHRRCTYYVVNVACIIGLICSFVLCAWGEHPANHEARWGIDFSLILTIVAFKLILSDMLPTLSYLTTLDYYVLAGFAFLSTATLSHSLLPRLYVDALDSSPITVPLSFVEGEEALVAADLLSFYVFAGVWALWNIGYSIFFIVNRTREYDAFVKQGKYEQEAMQNNKSSATKLKHQGSLASDLFKQ